MKLDKKVSIYKDDRAEKLKGFEIWIDYSNIWNNQELKWWGVGRLLLTLLNFKSSDIYGIKDFESIQNTNKIIIKMVGNDEKVNDLLSYLNAEIFKVKEAIQLSSKGEIPFYTVYVEEEDFNTVYVTVKDV